MPDDSKNGLLYAFGAFGLWGLLPIYWKWLQHVPSMEILGHRMVWSLVFVLGLLAVSKRWAWIRQLDRRTVGIYLCAALLLGANWGLYIWAVNTDRVVETALGYFINPLLNVALGVLVLGEKSRPLQWVAIGFAALGVLYLTFVYGELPWISLTLGFSFAFYGLFKKLAPLGAAEGLALETVLLFPLALAGLIYLGVQGDSTFGQADTKTHLLLIGSGVATALPLVFFTAAVRRLTLTVLGLTQYMAPTIQFFLGVFLFAEPFTATRLIGFVFIWAGLVVYSVEGAVFRRRARRAKA